MKNFRSNKTQLVKRITLILLITMTGLSAGACDICGCGVGSYYIGILPDFQKRFLGLRYQNKLITSHLAPGGGRSYLTTDERYHSVELWGAVNIGERFRVIGFVPLNHIVKQSSSHKQSKTGLGDIAAIGYYNIMKSETTTNNFKRLVHSLWLGGGIKLPTGKYQSADANENQNLNTFQLGSGSVDFSVNAMYDLRLHDAGLNTNMSYKMNTANNSAYQYGNKFTANMLLYYKFKLGEMMSVAPNTGILYETSAKDVYRSNVKVDLSGGYSTLYSIGTELRIGRTNIGGNYQIPISQSLGAGVVEARSRWMTHISYGF